MQLILIASPIELNVLTLQDCTVYSYPYNITLSLFFFQCSPHCIAHLQETSCILIFTDDII